MTDHPHDIPTLDDLVTSDPEVLGGRRVFRGTRVPVEILFENLADGMSIDEILDQYESLDRDDVVRVLELAAATLGRSASGRMRVPVVERAGVPRQLAAARQRAGLDRAPSWQVDLGSAFTLREDRLLPFRNSTAAFAAPADDATQAAFSLADGSPIASGYAAFLRANTRLMPAKPATRPMRQRRRSRAGSPGVRPRVVPPARADRISTACS